MNKVKIKICGLTRQGDVTAAIEAGADALGFVFVSSSVRCLPLDRAADLVRQVPPFITRVGLFLDQDPGYVESVLRQVPLNLLQFHGLEDAAYCRQFGRPYIKALHLDAARDMEHAERAFPDAAGILVDSHKPGRQGGTGKTLDWRQVKPWARPLILAGGLTAENVAQAIRVVRPWGVDVSSGVETRPGIKDAGAIREFIAAVNKVETVSGF